MNSPLPKPTQPAKDDKQQQNVVFDQSNKTNDDSNSRIPLAQKPTTPTPTPVTPKQETTAEQTITAPKPTLPPSSLSALSSMSSNKIPSDNNQNTSVAPLTSQRTVLGQPIPQAIRGEAAPSAFGKPAPVSTSQSVPSQPEITPSPGSSPMPTSGNIKQENPEIGSKDESKKGAPKIATAKSPVMKFLPFIVGGIVLLIIIVVVLSRVLGGSSSTSVSQNSGNTAQPTTQPVTAQPSQRTEVPAERVTLDYWGLWEPSNIMEQVISDFENENPGIEINYVKQSPVDYRERLQTAIESGSGPDLFRFHASWVPMLKNDLDVIPASVVSASDFKNNYYPVVTEQLVYQGQYVGLPLMYDGLVLFYNEDILETADETAPSTWSELRSLAVKLTVPSASGIQRGGLAIGNATNVEHFSDILATLILQNGGNLSEADAVETRDALLFYTNFQIADKVWDETLPSSTVAFARGDVAMMFAPSWRAHDIMALNPDLKFATTTMPQLSEDEPITWASYWAEGISAESDSSEQAAIFLEYLNREEVLKKFYSAASEVRAFGEIYPKADMADELAEDNVIGSILDDAIYAQSGYMNSYTHDNGINDLTIGYYKAAIDEMIDGADAEDVQEALNLGVSQVLKQYGVSTK